MTIAEFEPWVDAGEAITGGPNPGPTGFMYRATYDRGGPNETVFEGDYPNAAPAVGSAALPNHIDYDPLYMLDWEVSFTGGANWFPIGSTDHEVYVTLDDPLPSHPALGIPLLHTVIDLACRRANGLDDQDVPGIIDRIWLAFSDRNIYRVRDQARPLTYYGSWNIGGGTVRELLSRGDGQCGAWVTFFLEALLAHGIRVPTPYTTLWSVRDNFDYGFLVPEWIFAGPGISGNPTFPYLMVPAAGWLSGNVYQTHFTEFVDMPGIPGQGRDFPGSQNPKGHFSNHQVCSVNGIIYDPSYGLTYTDLFDFEDALHGYYQVAEDYSIIEATIGVDLNQDGDLNDSFLGTVLQAQENTVGFNLQPTIAPY